jgi:alpha-tubulin suppressor-like RCC1 family protein
MVKSQTQFGNIINSITSSENHYDNSLVMSEANIMSILFSRSNENLQRLLNKDESRSIDDLKTYYDYNMQIVDLSPSTINANILDIDISDFNSQLAIKYYFLLDLLSEIYGALATKSPATTKLTNIKCRYIIRGDIWQLSKRPRYYTFSIEYQYDKMSGRPYYAIKDTQDEDDKMVKKMCSIFDQDIIRHIEYFKKADIIAKNNRDYLLNIQAFYKFCRLKLVYFTLSSNPAVRYFADRYLPYCFINLKKQIITNNISKQDILTTSKILLTKQKLKDINQLTDKKKRNLQSNHKISSRIEKSYNKELLYVTIVIACIFLIIAAYIHIIDIDRMSQFNIGIVMIIVIVLIYVTINYMANIHATREYFNQLDKIFRFPRTSATGNDYTDTYAKRIRINGSTYNAITTSYWNAFDNNPDTFWESNRSAYSNGIATRDKAEYIMIDLGENIVLKSHIIKFSEMDKAPKNFQLYATNQSATFWGSIPSASDKTWTLIQDAKHVRYSVDQKRFDIIPSMHIQPCVIAAGREHSLFIHNEIAYAMGWNLYGQLGNGMTLKSFSPERVLFGTNVLTGVIEVAAGATHSLFLKSDGTVLACGENEFGQLGDAGANPAQAATVVNVLASAGMPLTDIVQIKAGHKHSLFLKINKTVLACGENSRGQLGDGTLQNRNLPVQVLVNKDNRTPLTNVIQLGAGIYSFESYFLKKDGTLFRCGTNDTMLTTVSIAQYVYLNDKFAKRISVAGGTCLCLIDDGTVMAIGNNIDGQFGNGSTQSSSIAVPIAGLSNIGDVIAGASYSFFIKNNKTVLAAGKNNFGQLGIGKANERETIPTLVQTATTLQNVSQIAAGANHSLFLDQFGKLSGSGWNAEGALGTYNTNVPIDVTPISQENLCTLCINSANPVYMRISPTNISTINSNVMRSFSDGYENYINSSIIENDYRCYALVINKIVGNATSVKINEWVLNGVYKNQLTTLESIKTDTYNRELSQILNDIEVASNNFITSSNNFNIAVEEETRIMERIEILESNIAQSNIILANIAMNPALSIALTGDTGLRAQVERIQDDIVFKDLQISIYNGKIAASNTAISNLNLQTNQQIQLNSNLKLQHFKYRNSISTFQDYQTRITSLGTELGDLNVGIHNFDIQFDYLKTSMNLALSDEIAALQLSTNTNILLIEEKEVAIATVAGNIGLKTLEIKAQIKLLDDEYAKLKQIAAAQELAESLVPALAEAEANKIAKLRDWAKQRLDTEISEDLYKSASGALRTQTNNLANRKYELDNLKADINSLQKTGDALKNQNIEITNTIQNIESDKIKFVNTIEREKALLQQRRNAEINRLQQDINSLQIRLESVRAETTAEISVLDSNIRDFNSEIENFQAQVRQLSDEIVAEYVERQKYKYISQAISIDSSSANIQTRLLYNINSTAIVIANSIILTGMENEYKDMMQRQDDILLLEGSSTHHLDIVRRDDKIILATIQMILNVLLIAVIFMVIYNVLPFMSIILLMILVFLVIIIAYLVQVVSMVRSKAYKQYWPHKTYKKM